jgi:uncharacterized protein YbjT (DUF2867 family)
VDPAYHPVGRAALSAVPSTVHVVTGAFSYTGSYIARRLLEAGERARTLSRRPDPSHALSRDVEFAKLQFEDHRALAAALKGAQALYNTYWMRFPRGRVSWETALRNTDVLLRAASAASVPRVVQISVTNASEDSPLGYFRSKAIAERMLREAGVSYAIVRPTLIFEREDILIHNIAWALRRFPLFTIPGSGAYAVQPVSAGDVARLAVEVAGVRENVTIDAAGPVTYTFDELVRAIRSAVRARCRLTRVPAPVAVALAGAVGAARRDTLLTREEVIGLMQGLLVSHDPPRGRARFDDWLAECGPALGRAYVSERQRNWR